MRKRILIVFGTRPEAIKMAPLVKAFQKHSATLAMTKKNSPATCSADMSLRGTKQSTSYLLEPIGRNTAPAIALACFDLDPEESYLVRPNESTYIKMGEIHRLENPGKIDLVLIEAQVGEYTGENDIVRFDDDFKRANS